MEIPNQASWMISKILNMRKYWGKHEIKDQVVQRDKFQIARAHKNLRGDIRNVEWRNLTCHNVAEPKHVFILWLTLHGKLRTKDKLIKWGLKVHSDCAFCQTMYETNDHLFFECGVTRGLWYRLLS